uniref:Uncharacterized protein n=1 Tax=Aegilops tauschii subsp. strangulata TaxID=200361 RepID=A0A453M596_AEGTS
KLNRMASIAAEMFVGRERFATLLMMRLTETVILWLSDDQSFWEEIEEGPRALGPLGLQQVSSFCPSQFYATNFFVTHSSFPVLPGHAVCHPFRARPVLVPARAQCHTEHN